MASPGAGQAGAGGAPRWDGEGTYYRCGVLEDAKTLSAAPGRWRGKVWLGLARRWLAAGVGCDADLWVE